MIYDLQVRCTSCTRFLKLKAKASSEVVVTCPDRKCKSENTIKVVMLSDYVGAKHAHIENKPIDYAKTIETLQAKVDQLDGRTKEAKELKSQLEELQKYTEQLEGIIDGQG